MAKTVTMRIADDVYRKFVKRAERERRSLGKFIENAVLQYTEQMSFVDDEEMLDILNDQGLIRRMKQGIQDAKSRRGSFVA